MNLTRPRIILAEKFSDEATARLREIGDVRVLDRCDESALVDAVGDCDALLIRSAARVTATVIESGPRLKVIGRAGVGLDQVDVAAAAARGIRVVYTPAASTDSVAELTIGLMLALERAIVRADAMVREGRFDEARALLVGRELRGLTLGIVGMGRIGAAVGRIGGPGLGMRILYNDICAIAPLSYAANAVSKDVLYAESDVVTLHVPLTIETRGMIAGEALRRFKPTATLINTSRGRVVCPDALSDALRQSRLAGAAIDVHDPEPPPPNHPLRSAPNVILSPHLGARTEAALARMNAVVEDVIAVLQGHAPRFPADSVRDS